MLSHEIWSLTSPLIATPYSRTIATAAIIIAIAFLVARKYRRWESGWLSRLIDQRLHQIRQAHGTRRTQFRSIGPSAAFHAARFWIFRRIEQVERYVRFRLLHDIRSLHDPSIASFILVAIFISLFSLVAHPFRDYSDLLNPHRWWPALNTKLENWNLVSKVFEALFVVIIALIVFVAESIRESRNNERRRVLLRVTYMWPLALLVTLTPLGYLYAKPTGFIVVLALIIAALAIYAFARLLQNLLNSDTQEQDRRKLLKERVGPIIMESVRERVGNNILFELIVPA